MDMFTKILAYTEVMDEAIERHEARDRRIRKAINSPCVTNFFR